MADVPPIPLVMGWRKDPNPTLHALMDSVNEVAAEYSKSADRTP